MEIRFQMMNDTFTATYELTPEERETLERLTENSPIQFVYCMSADSFDMDGWYEPTGVHRTSGIRLSVLEGLATTGFVEVKSLHRTRSFTLSELGATYLEVCNK